MAFPRPLRVLVALSVLACTGCLGRPAPELASFPVRSELECRIHDFETLEIMDVAIVIDASSSTLSPAGADIDDDGVIGVFTQSVMTDYGDTRLTAQVAAVRSLVHTMGSAGTRFSIVSFTGRLRYPIHHAPAGFVGSRQAIIRADLTEDVDVLEAGLRRILMKGSSGASDFSSGMVKALRTLEETPAISPRALRVILFMADSSDPLIAGAGGTLVRQDPHMKTAAKRAIEMGVRIHTFGLGAAAMDEPPTSLTRIAGATGGRYTPVLDPNQLHCHLLEVLRPPKGNPRPVAGHRARGEMHAGSRLAPATTP